MRLESIMDLSDLSCSICNGKFKNKQSLATHKRRYHPDMQKQQGQQHDQLDSSSDDGSISNENQIDQSQTSPSEPGGSNENKSTTEEELTEEHETDNSKDHQTDPSESDVSESMHNTMSKTVSLPRKRKVKNPDKPLPKKRKKSHSMRNQNTSLTRTNVFDDHSVVGVLYSIEETLSNINSALHKQILKSKSPWNRLDAFNFKHNYFLNLEECSQQYFAKPMKDVLTEEEMTLVDAVQSEQNLKELAILLNENQELFMKLINRFEMCANKNK